MTGMPHWRNHKQAIDLSGAEQVIILIKSMFGGWNKTIQHFSKIAVRTGRNHDYDCVLRIRDFESKNAVKFKVDRGGKIYFISTTQTRMRHK